MFAERLRGALVTAALLAAPALATEDDLRTVAAMQSHNRVLVSFAPTLADPRLEEQRAVMAHFAAGAATRDLLFVQVAQGKVIGARDAAPALLRKFRLGAQDYRTLLIGKDGKIALSEPGPIAEDKLQSAIDAMPMRQAEVQAAREGRGKPAD